ncbi:unnamed protein product, partial [marine sediment metagenome]
MTILNLKLNPSLNYKIDYYYTCNYCGGNLSRKYGKRFGRSLFVEEKV